MKDIVEFLNAIGEHEYASEVANANNRLEAFSNGLDKDVMDCAIKAARDLVVINEQLRWRVQELEKELEVEEKRFSDQWELLSSVTAERDKAHQYWQISEGRCDALMQQRDVLLKACETYMSHGICDVTYYTIRNAIASVKGGSA